MLMGAVSAWSRVLSAHLGILKLDELRLDILRLKLQSFFVTSLSKSTYQLIGVSGVDFCHRVAGVLSKILAFLTRHHHHWLSPLSQ